MISSNWIMDSAKRNVTSTISHLQIRDCRVASKRAGIGGKSLDDGKKKKTKNLPFKYAE